MSQVYELVRKLVCHFIVFDMIYNKFKVCLLIGSFIIYSIIYKVVFYNLYFIIFGDLTDKNYSYSVLILLNIN